MQIKTSRLDWEEMKVCGHAATFGQVHFGLLKAADNVWTGSGLCSKE